MKTLKYILLIFVCISFSLRISAEQSNINLGAIAPLTGDFAINGEHIKKGLELAKDHLSQEGIKVNIFVEDACLPTKAQSALRHLINFKKIDALAANYCIVGLQGIENEIKKQKLITFQTSVVPQVFLEKNDYIFNSFPSMQEESKSLAEFAKQQGFSTAAIFIVSSPWGEEYRRLFEKEFELLGGKVITNESQIIGKNDFRAELLRIKSKKPDVLFFVHVGDSLATLIRQARMTGLKQSILTVHEGYNESLTEIADEAANNTILFVPFPIKNQNKALHPISSYAYSDAYHLGKALHRCKQEKQCVMDKLRENSIKSEFIMYQVHNKHFTINPK